MEVILEVILEANLKYRHVAYQTISCIKNFYKIGKKDKFEANEDVEGLFGGHWRGILR